MRWHERAAIRGVVRGSVDGRLKSWAFMTAIWACMKIAVQLDRYSAFDMINRGGTFLGSARFPEFRDEICPAVAIENLKNAASMRW